MKDSTQPFELNAAGFDTVSGFLRDGNNPLTSAVRDSVAKFGTPEEINAKATAARDLGTIKHKLREMNSPYLADLEWLENQRDQGAFVKMADYEKSLVPAGQKPTGTQVTLEISACQYFPWLMDQARHCIKHGELMPGRIIRVRNMKESEEDNGDLLAMNAAVQIIGVTMVETLSTNGLDGSNVHLGGAETITGYFGGIGMPNRHPVKWLEEYLYYYTRYGTTQALNISPGQLMVGYLLNQIGVDNEFKVSVFYGGSDSAFGVFHTLAMASLMSRPGGRSPLIGLNLNNSANLETIKSIADLRGRLGMTDTVRIEHHVTEAYKSIVTQPYCRRDDLVEAAHTVTNIAAKHEGGDPEVESTRDHPSDIMDYFVPKSDAVSSGLMSAFQRNYMDKHNAMQRTARRLIEQGVGVTAAANLHG